MCAIFCMSIIKVKASRDSDPTTPWFTNLQGPSLSGVAILSTWYIYSESYTSAQDLIFPTMLWLVTWALSPLSKWGTWAWIGWHNLFKVRQQHWAKTQSLSWSEVNALCLFYVVLLLSHLVVSNSVTSRTLISQALLSMGLPRQEYWSGLPIPSPGDLPTPVTEPASPALAGRFTVSPGMPYQVQTHYLLPFSLTSHCQDQQKAVPAQSTYPLRLTSNGSTCLLLSCKNSLCGNCFTL